jgi:uncharacterized membrane protein
LRSLTCKPGHILLIYFAISLGVSLLLSLMQIYISDQAAQVGGLDGLQTQAIWDSVCSILELAFSVLSPIWGFGLTFVTLQFARGEESHPRCLTAGFHRFGRGIGLYLLSSLLASLVSFIAVFVGILLMALLVNFDELTSVLAPFEQLAAENPALMEDPAFLSTLPWDQVISTMLLPLVLMVLFIVGLSVAMSYLLRLASYYIMDTPGVNPALAIIRSCIGVGKNLKTFLMLDLSHWWFFLLIVLLTFFSMIPGLPGTINLGTWRAFLWQLTYALGVCALYWWKGPQVMTTYALAYDKLKN